MTTFVISTAARNAACDAIVDLVDGGTGSPAQGACVIQTASTASPQSATLVTILLGATAFGAAGSQSPEVPGRADMTLGSASAAATATGTAGRFRLNDTDGTEVAHGDVGTSGATMTITNTSINTSDTIQLTAMTVTVPAS